MEKKKIAFTDETLIKMIQNNDHTEDCFEYLYKNHYKTISGFILKNNGDAEDAKDFFQYAIIIFYENIKSGKYVYDPTVKIGTYLFQIAKNRWFNELKKRNRLPLPVHSNESPANESITTDENLYFEEGHKMIEKLLGKLEEKCRQILVYFYYDRYSMEEIAATMGYANEQVARNRKNLCMKSLKEIVSHSEALYNELFSFKEVL